MILPQDIEKESFARIAPHLEGLPLSSAEKEVYTRAIHTTGDLKLPLLRFSPGALEAGCRALKAGAGVFCDVGMVQAGVNRKKLSRWGGTTHCVISDPETIALAQAETSTRAAAAFRRFGKDLEGQVVVIGNAPTALLQVIELFRKQGVTPALTIGIPVGFVMAQESKEELMGCNLEWITLPGTRGGSAVAAACLNALLGLAERQLGE